MKTSPPRDDQWRLQQAFRYATGRRPDDEESQTLSELLIELTDSFASDESKSIKYLESINLPFEEIRAPRSRQAAWVMLASTLINLSESVTFQ